MDPGQLSPDQYSAAEVARLLELQPLDQEGGYFRRTAESDGRVPGTTRRSYSVIYFLVTPQGFSALHRIETDEVWCFHAGDPLESLRLAPDGNGRWVRLGLNLAEGETPQDIVPAGVWQGTRLRPGGGGRWALVSCVMAPEFQWSEFTLGEAGPLAAQYPAFAADIRALTREGH